MKISFRQKLGMVALIAALSLGNLCDAVNFMVLPKRNDDELHEKNRRRIAAAIRLIDIMPTLSEKIGKIGEMGTDFRDSLFFSLDANMNPNKQRIQMDLLLNDVLANLQILNTPGHESDSEDKSVAPRDYKPCQLVTILYSSLLTFKDAPPTILEKGKFIQAVLTAQASCKEFNKSMRRRTEIEKAEAAAADAQGSEMYVDPPEEEAIELLRKFSVFFEPSEVEEANMIKHFLEERKPTDDQWKYAHKLLGINPDQDGENREDSSIDSRMDKYAVTLGNRLYKYTNDCFSCQKDKYIPLMKILSKRGEDRSGHARSNEPNDQAASADDDSDVPPALQPYYKFFIKQNFGSPVPHKDPNGQYKVPTHEEMIAYGDLMTQRYMDAKTIANFFQVIIGAVSRKTMGKPPKFPEEVENFYNNLITANKLLGSKVREIETLITQFKDNFPKGTVPYNLQHLLKQISVENATIGKFLERSRTTYSTTKLSYELSYEEIYMIENTLRGKYKGDFLEQVNRSLESFRNTIGINAQPKKEENSTLDDDDDDDDEIY